MVDVSSARTKSHPLLYRHHHHLTTAPSKHAHTLLPYRHHLPSPSTSRPLPSIFGSLVTLSSRHPSRATLTRRLGCLGGMCLLLSPFPLPSYPMSSICKLQAVLTISARYPPQATFACRFGCLSGGARGLFSLLVALVDRLFSILDFTRVKYCLTGAVGFSVCSIRSPFLRN